MYSALKSAPISGIFVLCALKDAAISRICVVCALRGAAISGYLCSVHLKMLQQFPGFKEGSALGSHLAAGQNTSTH